MLLFWRARRKACE
ncbi:hypothetical protein M2H05_17125 [Vibrio vulnificus]|nr:hypothetical protein [Vibrio vulnificus]MCU8220175.1 hypothetical protein [Vibrio vulnificus]MCU8552470.1 hypothetical protein [Vibrio vulnificus]